jgi:hypothetical protein
MVREGTRVFRDVDTDPELDSYYPQCHPDGVELDYATSAQNSDLTHTVRIRETCVPLGSWRYYLCDGTPGSYPSDAVTVEAAEPACGSADPDSHGGGGGTVQHDTTAGAAGDASAGASAAPANVGYAVATPPARFGCSVAARGDCGEQTAPGLGLVPLVRLIRRRRRRRNLQRGQR